MLRELICVSLLIVITGCSSMVCASDSLAVRIYSDSSIYLRGDYIPLDVFVVNNTDRPLSIVPLRRYDNVKFRCYDSGGKRVEPYSRLDIGYVYGRETYTLPPHDSLITGFELNSGIGRPAGKNGLLWEHPLGDFTVEVVYTKKLVSNRLQYSVVEPTGVEGEIYRQLLSISNSHNYNNLVDAIPELEDLLARYPRSVYAPQFLDLMVNAFLGMNQKDDAIVIAYGKRLVSDYPYFWDCIGALNKIDQRLPSPENVHYLQEVIATKANTRAAFSAKVVLGRRGNN